MVPRLLRIVSSCVRRTGSVWPTVPDVAPLIGITGRASTGTALGIRAPHLVDSPIDLFFAEYGQRLAGCGAAPVVALATFV